MTLLRQLIIVIVFLFLLLFAGTFAINVNNTRDFLNTQLQTVSQDMATSLGLTLSPHMANKEMVVIESMVNAVFDSGYYREVVVLDVDGKPLIERVQPVVKEMAPEWFVRLIPLETPKAEGLIMDGWQQGGTIRISANPGYAYATLWANAVQDFFWFLGASVLVSLLGMLALYYVLRPLRALESQAKAICEREYPVQTKLPWTRELRRVVEAMNLMSVKVREMFAEQGATLERLRDDAYRDALTGLANRSYFEMQLRHLIDSEDQFGNGALVFLEVSNIIAINERLGYQKGDALLRGIGDLIQEEIVRSDTTEGFAARLSGPTFAIVIDGVSQQEALEFVTSLSCALPELQHKGLADTGEIGHIGLAMYRGQSFSQLMSETDMALRAAQIKGINATHQHDPHAIGEFGALTGTQWISLLRKTVEHGQSTLLLQPSTQMRDLSTVLHQEVLLRIAGEDGKLIPASIFIPMVHRHGFTQAFDRMVISEVLGRLKNPGAWTGVVAINLLAASISDPEFVEWAFSELSAHPVQAARIRFELSDYAVMNNLHAMQAWIRRIAPTGARIGIDHFGRGFSSINYLSTLRIEYIKIDGSFIRGIDSKKDNQSFVESLINIAHTMDILVIAESVETAEELAMVQTLRFDGVQGYGVRRPEVWEV
jgi:diguanylate cyclase (GGDEF)-like protein